MSRTLIFVLVLACLTALVINNAEAQPGGGFYGGRCRCRRYRCRRWERYSGRCYGGGGGGYNNWNMGGGGGGWGRRVRCCRRRYGGGGWD